MYLRIHYYGNILGIYMENGKKCKEPFHPFSATNGNIL